MKKYIKEEYAGTILQLAHKYINDNPDKSGSEKYAAMAKTLETMDMYVAWINNMGFMMHDYSIVAMTEYIDEVKFSCGLPAGRLEEIKDYLAKLI